MRNTIKLQKKEYPKQQRGYYEKRTSREEMVMRQFILIGGCATINKHHFYCPFHPRAAEVFCGKDCMWFVTKKARGDITEVFCKDSFMGVLNKEINPNE